MFFFFCFFMTNERNVCVMCMLLKYWTWTRDLSTKYFSDVQLVAGSVCSTSSLLDIEVFSILQCLLHCHVLRVSVHCPQISLGLYILVLQCVYLRGMKVFWTDTEYLYITHGNLTYFLHCI
uniref:Uncharacterized protein n=1 Tax=Cacopsylla melanoneura TaxID=428564 RepID=A0A8D8R959_9HEMI